ncbi:ketoacyl-ACP synthase III family protein [Streptomyces sp. NBC_00503]|uniref:ketoacyl-ACP synthase III family protein n=1 Tax=Streptomyces sp. NBC_00503 TaxID=2903659 RepID=UPI002E8037FC|nr:ketoacyl-ACP synthase III family protein [Streptomyces sp. NBC_00503]WUD86511.1 ketoacyl-ACP synthase III family protein [Streptomyces sp. NBC_00503]
MSTDRTPRLGIAGTGSYLPERRLDLDAEAARHDDSDADRIRATGYRTIAAEESLYPGDMALVAAERALAAAGVKAQDVDLIAVTSIHRHGHQRLWSPASWLQSRLGATRALPFTVNQGCNAQLLVLDLVTGLLGAQGRRTALVVATDRFAESGFDRFTADYGIVYGDGAAAMVLTAIDPADPAAGSATEAPAWRVLATHSVSDPALEGLHRLDAPAPETSELIAAEHDVRAAKKRYLAAHGGDSLRDATRSAVREIRRALLPDGDDFKLRRVVYPNLGLPLLEENYFPEFPGGSAISLWEFGATVGHLGSGDQIAGLDHLERTETFATGDRVLLLGAGAGFTWTGVLLERG